MSVSNIYSKFHTSSKYEKFTYTCPLGTSLSKLMNQTYTQHLKTQSKHEYTKSSWSFHKTDHKMKGNKSRSQKPYLFNKGWVCVLVLIIFQRKNKIE